MIIIRMIMVMIITIRMMINRLINKMINKNSEISKRVFLVGSYFSSSHGSSHGSSHYFSYSSIFSVSSIFVIISILFIIFFICSSNIVMAFGVSPAELSFPKVVAGEETHTNILISSVYDDDWNLIVEDGGLINDGASGSYNSGSRKIGILKVPNNLLVNKKHPMNLRINFTLFNDLPSGTYKGIIYFKFIPSSYYQKNESLSKLKEESKKMKIDLSKESNIILSIPVHYTISITNSGKSSCILGGVQLSPAEVGEPINIRYSIINDGTLRVFPNMKISFYNDNHNNHNNYDNDNGVLNDIKNTILFTDSWIDKTVLPADTVIFNRVIKDVDLSQPGNYTVILRSDCGVKSIDYQLLEKGSLNNKGFLKDLVAKLNQYDNINSVENSNLKPVLLIASFKNDGDGVVNAYLKGVVMDTKTNKIIKTIKGDSLLVLPGEHINLDASVNIPLDKDYLVKTKVIYEGKESNEEEVIIKKPEIKNNNFTLPLSLITIFLIVFILLILIIRKKRIKKGRNNIRI